MSVKNPGIEKGYNAPVIRWTCDIAPFMLDALAHEHSMPVAVQKNVHESLKTRWSIMGDDPGEDLLHPAFSVQEFLRLVTTACPMYWGNVLRQIGAIRGEGVSVGAHVFSHFLRLIL